MKKRKQKQNKTKQIRLLVKTKALYLEFAWSGENLYQQEQIRLNFRKEEQF